MSLLGDNHQAIYPSNISSGELNRFYLEVTNHMGNAVYYEIHTKFGGPNDSGPDSFRHKNSNLEAIDVMFFEAVNNQSVEFPLDVSFDYSIDDAASELHLMNLTINGEPLNVEDKTIEWDLERKGYYGNLFFELWIQNDTVNTLQYHQRYVSLWFKFNQ
jgi:hypothetical protein